MSGVMSQSMRTPMPPWRTTDDFLSAQANADLLSYVAEHESSFIPTTVALSSERVDATHRSSRKLDGGLGPWKDVLSARFAEMFPHLASSVGIRQLRYSRIELEIVAHNDGDRFGRHVDTLSVGNADEGTARFLSAVYYFFDEPPGFDGGELRLYPFGAASRNTDFVDVIPRNNSLVYFPSFAPHEVLPVRCRSRDFAKSRFAVNCWFHRDLT